jgi:DNA-binding transcriptional MerR regulator
VSSRSYLSIGDVLTLLREEFPDVTISKIRFLESQGLVNPERSPSGYRKFFDHDVERLRWVLRQQREHFLPLKVIRDRLAEGDLGEGPPEAEPVADPAHRNGRVTQPAPVGVAAGPGRTEEQMARADDEAMARILADASRRTAQIPDPAPARPPLQVVANGPGAPAATTGTPPSPVAPVAGGAPGKEAPVGSAAPPPRDRPAPEGGSPAGATTPITTTGSGSPAPGRPARDAAAPTAKGGGEGRASGSSTPDTRAGSSSMVTGASLTAEELCSASGLSAEELAGLQGFGLIESIDVAGILTFDEDALTVANLAAEFRVFGIEPRHLRLYKNAVDRELGLIEQVIIPLLRQRNPESRQRAVEGAEQLGSLGQTMRATLLRSALRHHIGG